MDQPPFNQRQLLNAYAAQKARALGIMARDPNAKFALVHDLEEFPGYALVTLVMRDGQVIAMVTEREKYEDMVAELRTLALTHA